MSYRTATELPSERHARESRRRIADARKALLLVVLAADPSSLPDPVREAVERCRREETP